jgi:hypothetical protein
MQVFPFSQPNSIGGKKCVTTHGFCKETAHVAQIYSFRDFIPYLGVAHLAVLGCFEPFSPNMVVQQLPCE